MKNPHDTTEYQSAEDEPIASDMATEAPPAPDGKKRKKPKLSGAYYYVDVDGEKLAEAAFVRTILTIIAIALQLVILALPQGSLEYVASDVASLGLIYVMYVFVYVIISVWLVVMNMTRYKFGKRIPKEYAPKHGFKNRAFFGAELFMAANAIITVFEIIFVSLSFDVVTLVAVFLSALALTAAVFARQVTYLALRHAQFVPAKDNAE